MRLSSVSGSSLLLVPGSGLCGSVLAVGFGQNARVPELVADPAGASVSELEADPAGAPIREPVADPAEAGGLAFDDDSGGACVSEPVADLAGP